MNTFGTSNTRIAIYDPRCARDGRARFRRDRIQLLEKANSLQVPVGRCPTCGYLLVARSEYDKLNSYSTSLELDIGDPRQPDNVGTLKNLSIVQAQCVTRGLEADDNALYLVEITDGRGIVSNQWFQFPLTAQYNVRAPAYPQTFYPGSMNGGTTWTWETMLQDIWDRINSFIGNWPGFPQGVTVAGTPEGFRFVGVSAWNALCDILDHIGMTVACDLTQDNPFTIVRLGAADSSFDELADKYGAITSGYYRLEDDLEWIDTGAGRVPKTVDVLFRRRNSIYGTEETVTYRSDGPYQWSMTPYYSVSVTAPAVFTNAVGRHYLWSDFTVRYDMDNNPLAEDTAIAATIAAERVAQYFAVIYRQTLGYMTRVYSGALPFTTGSQVDAVCWYQKHAPYQSGDGWRTKIIRGEEQCR